MYMNKYRTRKLVELKDRKLWNFCTRSELLRDHVIIFKSYYVLFWKYFLSHIVLQNAVF